jgi:hypothetical protein
MNYLSGAAIARLKTSTLMAANKAMHASTFGPLIRRRQSYYAAQDEVERELGQLSAEQLAAAVDGKPLRMIEI